MRKLSFLLLLPMLLIACSDETPETAQSSSNDTAVEAQGDTATPAADTTALARLGIVFTDSDPWMAGAVISRGTIRVGDSLTLLTSDDQRIPVRITAIRDDATQSDVTEASAPQGVFASFSPVSAGTTVPGSDSLLIGNVVSADYAQALRLVDASLDDA